MAEEAAATKKPEPAKGKEAAPAGAAPKAKFDILGLLLFVLVLVNIGAVAGLGMFIKKIWEKVDDLQHETQRLATPEAAQNQETQGIGKEMQGQKVGTLYPLESFLVNIASDQGPKFLQTQMELELADPAVEDELSRKKAAVRDAIIVLLSSRSFKEMRDPSGMKKLRGDLLRVINNLLSAGKVKEIYFTQFHFN